VVESKSTAALNGSLLFHGRCGKAFKTFSESMQTGVTIVNWWFLLKKRPSALISKRLQQIQKHGKKNRRVQGERQKSDCFIYSL
jgi:hypothetical protein